MGFAAAVLISKAFEVASTPTRLELINSALEESDHRAFILSMGNAAGALVTCVILLTYTLWTGHWPQGRTDVENLVAIGAVVGLLGTSLFWAASRGHQRPAT